MKSSADRLRRLRLVLTAVITAANAVGLIVVAWLAIQADDEQRDRDQDAELRIVTKTVSRLLQSSATDSITTARAARDELNEGCPQFAVLPAGGGDFEPYYSKRECARPDRQKLLEFAQKAVRDQTDIYGQIGTDQPIRFRVEPFRGASGRFVGAIAAFTDASDHRAEHVQRTWLVIGGAVLLISALGATAWVISGRVIRPAANALEQQEVLLAETAHDLRTPVAALRALAETALRNPSEQAELLPRTVKLAARMGGIIDGLLVRARLAAGVDRLAVQPVWLDQLVAGIVDDTDPKGASVTLTAAPCTVLVDPALVQRAIGNLLGNALRYGKQPGQQAIVHITVAGGRVTVADHGPGVDPETATEMFDRFRTGSNSSGLGLSIVRWVAQAHGGRLNLYNAPEGGAIFELELPVA